MSGPPARAHQRYPETFSRTWDAGEKAMTTGLRPGKDDRERGAPPRAADHVDLAAVRLGDPLADGETEAGAGPLPGAGARRVGAPEAVEDVREITRRDADARVGDAQGHATVGGTELHAHAAAGGRVLYGVCHEVEDELADPARIHRHYD